MYPQAQIRQGCIDPAAVKQHCEPQQQGQTQRRTLPCRRQILKALALEAAPVTQHQTRKHPLFFTRESGHVCIFQHIGTVPMVMRMSDIQAQLMQLGRPAQQLFMVGIEIPVLADLPEQRRKWLQQRVRPARYLHDSELPSPAPYARANPHP